MQMCTGKGQFVVFSRRQSLIVGHRRACSEWLTSRNSLSQHLLHDPVIKMQNFTSSLEKLVRILFRRAEKVICDFTTVDAVFGTCSTCIRFERRLNISIIICRHCLLHQFAFANQTDFHFPFPPRRPTIHTFTPRNDHNRKSLQLVFECTFHVYMFFGGVLRSS